MDGLIFMWPMMAQRTLWVNKGDGTFEENGLMAGAAYSADGVARAGMGVAAGDIDNDEGEDVLVTNLAKEGSTLYLNNGLGTFEDALLPFNLSRPAFHPQGSGWAGLTTTTTVIWICLPPAARVMLLPSLRGTVYPYREKNQLFHNEGEKKAFREVSPTAGPAFQLSERAARAAFGDIDNDGDVDILSTNNNGPARLLLNENTNRFNWLELSWKL
ncbi:MAG: VCBS repeat-containing protein [Pyrinomonadaceae bacterium]